MKTTAEYNTMQKSEDEATDGTRRVKKQAGGGDRGSFPSERGSKTQHVEAVWLPENMKRSSLGLIFTTGSSSGLALNVFAR